MGRGGSRHKSARQDTAGLAFAILFPSVAAWLYFVSFADAPFMPALYTASKLVQFAFPLTWMLLVHRQRPGRWVPAARDLTAGAVSGGAIVLLMGSIYFTILKGSDLAQAASPRIVARIEAIGAASPAKFLLLALFLSIIHSFFEEYYWRWFVFERLRLHTGRTFAMTLSSVAFAAHHVIVLHAFIGFGPYWWVTMLLSAGVAIGGGLWAWLYARSGSLLSPWLSHALVDMGIMAIGYDLSWG